MSDRLVGILLLICLVIIFIIHPYYFSFAKIIHDIAWFGTLVLGAYASIKLIR